MIAIVVAVTLLTIDEQYYDRNILILNNSTSNNTI